MQTGKPHIILACATIMEMRAVLHGLPGAERPFGPACGPEGTLPLPEGALPHLSVNGRRLSLLVCGVGPVASAYSLGVALRALAAGGADAPGGPVGVVHMGVCGSYDLGKAPCGSLVLVTGECLPEYGLRPHDSEPGPMPFAQACIDGEEVHSSLPLMPEKALGNMGLNCHSAWARGLGVTVAGVSATRERAARMAALTGGLVESMEGFSLALASAAAHVNFVEVRAVSNEAGIRPPAGWNMPAALEGLGRAAATLFS